METSAIHCFRHAWNGAGIDMKVMIRANLVEEFENKCHDPQDGRFCQSPVHRTVDAGVLSKGKHQMKSRIGICGSKADGSGMCDRHKAAAEKMKAKLIAKRAKDAAWKARNS